MTINLRRIARPVKLLTIAAIASAALAAVGCGDDPSRLAGTIDVPKRERPRPDSKGTIIKKDDPRTSND